jgi:hypothetical protein
MTNAEEIIEERAIENSEVGRIAVTGSIDFELMALSNEVDIMNSCLSQVAGSNILLTLSISPSQTALNYNFSPTKAMQPGK